MKNSNSPNHPIHTFIKIVALSIVLVACFFIVKPFLLIIVWSIVVAVALYPIYKKVIKLFKGKKKGLVTSLFIIILLAIIVTPTIDLTAKIIESSKEYYQAIHEGNIKVPPPAIAVKNWPFIGDKVYSTWSQANMDLENFIDKNNEPITNVLKGLFSSFAGLMGSVLLGLFSLVIAGFFMLYAESGYNTSVKLANKLVTGKGKQLVTMSTNTIRSVVKGILLVGIIQAALAYIGFILIGLPGAEIFAILVLVFAIVQLPPVIIMIPAIALAFSITGTTPAIIFAIYSILIGGSDNILKPLLLGKGLETPMLVILIGAIGGMISMGILGLFIGPVILAIAYQGYNAWVSETEQA
jgi:predicted PurR-regulated permease PerM